MTDQAMTDQAMTDQDWRALNKANWNERVPIHLAAPNDYDQTPLRNGTARLEPIASAAIGPVAGLNILHLQCHFGMDSLTIAQQGASVVGVDFSEPAIVAARALAVELGLHDRSRFIEADLYGAPSALPEPGGFDRVFVTWGALNWLPDIAGWARVVAYFLKPGGWLALAEAHPAAYVFDDAMRTPDGMPGWYVPYLGRTAIMEDRPEDYADPSAVLTNSRFVEWLHPLSDIVMGLLGAGLRLEFLHEHDTVRWKMFDCLVPDGRGGFRWPDKPWLPLSYSLRASKPA
ncbi:MAG TPA: class I SAM-dependent methyltransferase [Rhodopila sp.]|jgi:SAM-dependent methyltransferase